MTIHHPGTTRSGPPSSSRPPSASSTRSRTTACAKGAPSFGWWRRHIGPLSTSSSAAEAAQVDIFAAFPTMTGTRSASSSSPTTSASRQCAWSKSAVPPLAARTASEGVAPPKADVFAALDHAGTCSSPARCSTPTRRDGSPAGSTAAGPPSGPTRRAGCSSCSSSVSASSPRTCETEARLPCRANRTQSSRLANGGQSVGLP